MFFLYRSISFSLQFCIGTIKLRASEQVDWQAKVEGLENIAKEIVELEKAAQAIKQIKFEESLDSLANRYKKPPKLLRFPRFLQRLIFRWEKAKTFRFIKQEISNLKELSSIPITSYREIQNVIIIPHAKEPLEVLDATLQNLANQTFPLKQINIVLGAEARDPEGLEKSIKLQKKYKEVFGNIWVSNHVLTEEEIVGKSSNMAAAGKVASKEIAKLGWDLKKTIVTSCDADSKLPPEYFSYLTYKYITTPDAEYKFYNGAIVMYANIWRVDFLARVRNSLSSMYNVGKLLRTDKLIPFSTYSTSFWLVDQIGYWTPWITPEDFHLFFKSSFKFPHKVSTIPMYTKIMVDAAEGEGYVETFKNNYYQSRRWQWGVSDDGWLIKNLLMNIGRYPLKVYYRALHVIFDHILAPTSSFLLLLGANLPPLLSPEFKGQVFGEKLPGISSTILQFTFVTLLVAIMFDMLLKPKRDGVSLIRRLLTPLEWFLTHVVGFLLTSIPGLEAHTRLLFGKYLEYYITKKRA